MKWTAAPTKERKGKEKTKAKVWNDVKNIYVGIFNLWLNKQIDKWKTTFAMQRMSMEDHKKNYYPDKILFHTQFSSLCVWATFPPFFRNSIHLCCFGWFRAPTFCWLGLISCRYWVFPSHQHLLSCGPLAQGLWVLSWILPNGPRSKSPPEAPALGEN